MNNESVEDFVLSRNPDIIYIECLYFVLCRFEFCTLSFECMLQMLTVYFAVFCL